MNCSLHIGASRIGCAAVRLLCGIALIAALTPLQAQTRGVVPPSLSYNPPPGTPINLSLGGFGGTGGASIQVTPVGGSGSGSFATTGLNCTITGNGAAAFSVSPSSFSFMPGSSSATIGLSCNAGQSPLLATLLCNESPGGSTGPQQSWPLQCPAALPIPPNLNYDPSPGSTITFSPGSGLIGTSTTASIRITPSGGFGTGFAATAQFNNCRISNESVPGTISGFQGTSFTFVGATTAVQTLNLSATLRASAVTGTLTCDQVLPGGGQRGSVIITPRSWPLQVAAGTQPAANLRLLKTASAQQVQVNEEFSYNVQASNVGSSPEFGLVVIDQVPSALTILSAAGPDWTCRVDANTVDCRLPELIGGRSADITIQVRAPNTPRSIANTARMTSLSTSTALVSSVSVDVVAPPPTPVDLAIDKSDSADPVRTGSSFSYLLAVSNLGAGDATGVRVEDVLPAGVTLIAATGPGWTCSGSSTISCTLTGVLAAGASSSVSIEVTAPSQATTLNNRATVSANEPDSNSANNADTESTSITTEPPPPPPLRADLGISGNAVPASVLTGQNVSFEIAVGNIGPDPATAVLFDGALSAALEAIGASGNGWTCTVNARQVECTRTSIAVNATESLTVTARVLPGATGIADMALQVTSSVTDPVLANNASRVAVSYQAGGADLSIVKTDSIDPVAAGAEFSYTLTVSNAGPEAASGVVVSDTLPASLSFVSASGAGFTCANTAGTVRCTLATPLPAGASAAATIAVRAPTAGSSISNEGVVSASTNDPNLANNRSTQTTQINDRTAEQISDLLEEAAVDPASEAALPVVSAECADPSSALADVCDEILDAADDGRTGEVTDALRAIAPDEVLAQQLVLREIATTQFFNVDARLNELRRGGGGFSLSGLTVNSGGQSIPLSLAGDALQAALGYGDDEGGLISPWGFFVNGNITDGKQDLRNASGRVGVDYSSRGITAGVDYRLSNRSVVGAALGYAKFTSDVNTGSELDAKSLLLTGYGSYYVNDRFYVDTRLTYGNVKLDQSRSIRFQIGGMQVDELARGDADSTQLTLATSMGYHLNYGAWTVTPNLGLRYIRNDVDAFTETGAGAYNVSYRDQSFKTTQATLGLQIGRAVSLDTGVLMPQFDFSLISENSDDPRAQASLANGSSSQLFRLDQQGSDSSYGSAGLGFVYLMANGRQAYISYRHTFGNDDFDRGSLNLGGRFEF